MSQESRRERERRIAELNARNGFSRGFAEGGRYTLALLMGLPRPSEVVHNPDLEPGVVQIHMSGGNALQVERIIKLGNFLDALKDVDLKTAADPEEEISPARRLEQIVLYCTETARLIDPDQPGGDIALQALEEVVRRAQGKHRE